MGICRLEDAIPPWPRLDDDGEEEEDYEGVSHIASGRLAHFADGSTVTVGIEPNANQMKHSHFGVIPVIFSQ